ncbi:flagellar basal body P-ring protein FlgI [Thermosipho atlanticus]|uniref:Flagellar P-ring protein n=1 Tax=Thermosipho atlanticus DSM 15807 TaxID=1123380 RepID=A0A1M5T5M5_9BACT|nr:flagellar basal body P-ring protein FlgI [Thermosipho atlanticus]SHH46055.1 flagellar P-ring protein precursor FlgI [Thermosipho atlanticus DSM 15807]
MKQVLMFLFLAISIISFSSVRIKDIAIFRGAKDNQLFGIGIVVGLNGAGDDGVTYSHLVLNMLKYYGNSIPRDDLKSPNTALVLVVANIPAYYKVGMKIDVTLYAVGNAKSIEKGFLLKTELFGSDGKVYALAEGPINSLGIQEDQIRFKVKGFVQNGGTIIKEIPSNIIDENHTTVYLIHSEFSSAEKVSKLINEKFQVNIASSLEPQIIKLSIPQEFNKDLIGFLSIVEEIEVIPNQIPLIVIKEGTANIIYGEKEEVQKITYSQEGYKIEIKRTSTVLDLVEALKTAGISPKEIIKILLELHKNGAIKADVIVM